MNYRVVVHTSAVYLLHPVLVVQREGYCSVSAYNALLRHISEVLLFICLLEVYFR